MSAYGLKNLEHSCIQPGLWLIEGHQVRRLPNRRSTSRNPRGKQWVVVRLKSGNVPSPQGVIVHPTFEDAVATVADHIDKGCDCK